MLDYLKAYKEREKQYLSQKQSDDGRSSGQRDD